MDSVITTAARALSRGDALAALKLVALREDAPALALRGTAMAQLGDFARARKLLRAAAVAFGDREMVARARCVIAEAEVALASRDLHWDAHALHDARHLLALRGDRVNACHARLLEVRHLLLLGRLTQAEQGLDYADVDTLPPALRAVYELVVAGIAMRRVGALRAREALGRAAAAARAARIPSLEAEVELATRLLEAPAARAGQSLLRLDEVEALFASGALIVDACRLTLRQADTSVSLGGRTVPFTLLRLLAEGYPAEVTRDALVAGAFRRKRADDSLRARVRVELGRARRLVAPLAAIEATAAGFRLVPKQARRVVVITLPVESGHADVLALMADGEHWSTSSLALALDRSQRTVQRALESLASNGVVHAYGRARARRWIVPMPGITSALLLPVALGTN